MEKPFVLVADDNEATCTLITALLRNDFIVDTASDGMEAIAKLRNRQYAVIILDLLMPLVDGFKVLEFLAAERPETIARVIVVTAALGSRDLDRVRGYQVCDVVRKPFDVDTLLETVRNCAGSDGSGDVRAPFLTSGMILLLADFLRQRLM